MVHTTRTMLLLNAVAWLLSLVARAADVLPSWQRICCPPSFSCSYSSHCKSPLATFSDGITRTGSALIEYACPLQNCRSFESQRRLLHVSRIRGGSSEGLDPLVQASPIVAAAVCRDGVAVLALHPSSGELLHDISPDWGGPFRIQSIDATTVFLAAGWRADAMALTRQIREKAQDERRWTGSTDPSVLATHASHILASAARQDDVSVAESGWIARCVPPDFVSKRRLGVTATFFSLQLHPLHCVGLLASVSRWDKALWFMDATGRYHVRAMVIGKGSGSLLDSVREVDWTKSSVEIGWARLVKLVLECLEKTSSSSSFAVEIATLSFSTQKFQRRFLSELPSEIALNSRSTKS